MSGSGLDPRSKEQAMRLSQIAIRVTVAILATVAAYAVIQAMTKAPDVSSARPDANFVLFR